MAPSMVLLKRELDFSDDETESRGKSIRHPWDSREEPPRPQERAEAILEYLRTFKAHAVVADPPELSSLHILRPPQPAGLLWPCGQLDSGHLCSADKNLIALYARSPLHGVHGLPLGGYLIYDARNNSLSAIPQLPDDYDDEPYDVIGSQSALVMCNGDGGGRYVLAQLVRIMHSQAAFLLWKSCAPGWALQPARLQLPQGFYVHLCFSYRGSTLCWVDLLRGMVACHLGQDSDNSEPELRFIPLPKECTTYNNTHPRYERCHPYVEQLRSMACVGDTIKLVCLDTNVEHKPGEKFDLIVYALLPDLSEWTISSKYNVGDIWADETYRSTGMPKIDPSFPILSIHEDGVIYLVFTHLKLVDDTPLDTGRSRVEYRSQYSIRVDMKNNRLQLYPKSTQLRNYSHLLVSEISAYQQRLQDHPREMEASELGASKKRMIKL